MARGDALCAIREDPDRPHRGPSHSISQAAEQQDEDQIDGDDLLHQPLNRSIGRGARCFDHQSTAEHSQRHCTADDRLRQGISVATDARRVVFGEGRLRDLADPVCRRLGAGDGRAVGVDQAEGRDFIGPGCAEQLANRSRAEHADQCSAPAVRTASRNGDDGPLGAANQRGGVGREGGHRFGRQVHGGTEGVDQVPAIGEKRETAEARRAGEGAVGDPPRVGESSGQLFELTLTRGEVSKQGFRDRDQSPGLGSLQVPVEVQKGSPDGDRAHRKGGDQAGRHHQGQHPTREARRARARVIRS